MLNLDQFNQQNRGIQQHHELDTYLCFLICRYLIIEIKEKILILNFPANYANTWGQDTSFSRAFFTFELTLFFTELILFLFFISVLICVKRQPDSLHFFGSHSDILSTSYFSLTTNLTAIIAKPDHLSIFMHRDQTRWQLQYATSTI